jgi:hypothetical protein
VRGGNSTTRVRNAGVGTGGDGTLDALVSTSLTVSDVTIRASAVIVLSLGALWVVGARRARPRAHARRTAIADVRVDASRTQVLEAPWRSPRDAALAVGLLGSVAVGAGLALGLGVAIAITRVAAALAAVGAR